MCMKCDSGLDWPEFTKQTIDRLLDSGHQVVMVEPDLDTNPPEYQWAYSIGRTIIEDQPELVVTGAIAPNVQAFMVNDAIRAHKAGEYVVEAGTEVPAGKLLDGFPVRIIECDTTRLNMARRLFGDNFTALQLVWPDTEGVFPGEPGYAYEDLPEAQPIFGES